MSIPGLPTFFVYSYCTCQPSKFFVYTALLLDNLAFHHVGRPRNSTSLCTPCNPVAGIPSHGPPSAGCAAGHRTASSSTHTTPSASPHPCLRRSTQEASPEIFCLNMNKLHLKGSPTLAKDIKTSKGYPTLLFSKNNMQATDFRAVQPLQKTSKHERAIQPFFFKKQHARYRFLGLSNPCKRHQNIKGLSNPPFSPNRFTCGVLS